MKRVTRSDGAELVLADQLMEMGDVRGELIIVETELEALGIDHPKGALLAARADKLRSKAHAAWKKALKIGDRFELEMGLPSHVPVSVGERELGEIPEHDWIVGYRAYGPSETRLMELLRHPLFGRARSLVVDDVAFTWDGLSAFCSSPEVEHLERLDVTIPLGPRALTRVLSSSNLARLTRLEIGCRSSLDGDDETVGLDRVAGLPALRCLHLKEGLNEEVVGTVLRSPLARRLEEVRAHVLPEKLKLPNLRRLILSGNYPGRDLQSLFAEDSELPKLGLLDISDASITTAQALSLVDRTRLPSLLRLDISQNPIGEDAIVALRKRFGEQLIATQMREPRQKRNAAKPKLRVAGAVKEALSTAAKTKAKRVAASRGRA
jgi:hypothetical protein